MRGKALVLKSMSNIPRITPAYAGKSGTSVKPLSWSRDHPRLCGEKIKAFVLEVDVMGSPPPMRGKVLAFKSPKMSFRITPAYAGKSVWYSINSDFIRDHPRLCGEKHAQNKHRKFVQGITPAYAGKSRFLYEIRSTS